ncbi:MAG: carboxypeptidase regulatory-like domain-containing protein [Flavobacteriales bacterium]
MSNKQIFCTALAIVFVLCAKAQGFGEIHGKALDSLGLPLPGVIIVATNGSDIVGDQTDENGKYRLKPLKPGIYSVGIQDMRYDTITISGIVVNADKTIFLEPITAMEGNLLKAVVIPYRAPHLDPLNGTITTLGAKELEHNAAIAGGNINNLVSSMSSDIKTDGENLYFRGSRAGTVIYFIDGVKYTGNNVNIPASGINSVSVYTGGLPAKYGDTTGGVIVIETKNYLQDYYKKMNQ